MPVFELTQEGLLHFFSGFVYQPYIVYLGLTALMIASSFGLPVPEEVTLISVGLVAYLAQNPELAGPPPEPGLDPVNPKTAAAVAFGAVFLSDLLVYGLGRRFGRRALKLPVFKRLVHPRAIKKIEKWSDRYGAFAAGVFRFTPGLRFPGHLMCGVTGLSPLKFIAVDGLAVLISVPTQVLLLAYYGGEILGFLKQIKLVLLGVLLIALAALLARRFMRKA